MSDSYLTPEWDVYLEKLREDAHQLLAWGYADTRPKLAEAKDEYEITGLLANGMDARINSPRTPDPFTFYSIHNERPTSPSGQLGKERPKLDIQIERCGVRPKPCFTFEAKRLRDDANSSVGDTMRHYLGENGIQRFLRGHYAPESLEAAMLGCIQAHDAEFWFTQVGNAFDSDTSKGGRQYAVVGCLQHANVIADFPDERVSVHARASGTSMRIFHLYIDCRR
jgi:hypothetical protein